MEQGIPCIYLNKFNGHLEDLLQKTNTTKINWLFSVWAAQEAVDASYYPLKPTDTQTQSSSLIMRLENLTSHKKTFNICIRTTT